MPGCLNVWKQHAAIDELADPNGSVLLSGAAPSVMK